MVPDFKWVNAVNAEDFQESASNIPGVTFTVFILLYVAADAPKIQGAVAVYTWEGNPANISCEVLAHPGALVVWVRDGQQVPTGNTTNIRVYNTSTTSYLEVCCTSKVHT